MDHGSLVYRGLVGIGCDIHNVAAVDTVLVGFLRGGVVVAAQIVVLLVFVGGVPKTADYFVVDRVHVVVAVDV
ncbi:unnamed protein product, partial [Rotaria magnacalcarata]